MFPPNWCSCGDEAIPGELASLWECCCPYQANIVMGNSLELASLQGRVAHQTSTLTEMPPSPSNLHVVDDATTPVSLPGLSPCSWWLAAW